MTLEILRKTFTPHEVKLDDVGSIELAFAQFNVIDKDGDVTLPGAFPAKEVPISAYGHTSWDGALPVGKGTISEVGEWAVLKGQLFMDTAAGRETHATLKGLGPLAEYSYAYEVVKDGASFGQFAGQNVRFLKSLDTFEISPVLRGAGEGTHTRALKSGAPASDAPMAELLSWHSDGETAVLERFKGHALARASEGRRLSRSDRAAMEDYVETRGANLSMVRELLRADDPPIKLVDPVTLAVLLGTARANGVAV